MKKKSDKKIEPENLVNEELNKIQYNKNPNMEDVLKSQIAIYQFCHVLQAKNAELELKIQKLIDQAAMTEQSHQNLKKFLETIGDKIQDLKNRMMDEDPDEPRDQGPQQGNEKKVPIMRNQPLHDDVSLSCEVCNKVHHAKATKCPNCGFERNKKGR